MTRLVHLTDLHFGLHFNGLVEPLAAAVRGLRPELVVVSGDLTQRARPSQFAQAVAFLRGLALPVLVIPGNHDVPLYNLAARWTRPFGAYRRAVVPTLAPGLEPVAAAGHLRLFGANTATPWHWRRGVLRDATARRVIAAMRQAPEDAVNILVPHHPLAVPAGFERGETGGAPAMLSALAGVVAPVVLSGHLHDWSVGLGITPETPRPVLQVQTGTALCARVGERDHGFAVLDFDGQAAAVTRWMVDGAGFAAEGARRFTWGGGVWRVYQ